MIRPTFIQLITMYLGLVLLLFVFFPTGKTGADESKPQIDLSLSPVQQLFNIHNMKPGDWMTRTLTIQNKGNQDFMYQSGAYFISGSKMLYNQLVMTVSAGDEILYEGKLSGFNGFEKRPLAHLEEEELTYTVEFPYESGNEFQGLTTKVAFHFAAGMLPEKVTESVGAVPVNGDPSSFGSALPKTGEINPIIFYLIGLALIAAGIVLYRKKRNPFIWMTGKGRSQ
ncbi:hypothetical protein DCC39_15150 [Pueribacillus theae]|uniref:Gram-positive cocci surface proteins LPxTG domain-containing protein n=1 Tax=Pueribacillus theae TaxID=2171751 RepID=A0A2U1JST9_9BACI|nr:TasA family protein [Pueribacillus theae]PWA08270.1 hypothetical protein DCC39_15150 [Pueribacillus theae]